MVYLMTFRYNIIKYTLSVFRHLQSGRDPGEEVSMSEEKELEKTPVVRPEAAPEVKVEAQPPMEKPEAMPPAEKAEAIPPVEKEENRR